LPQRREQRLEPAALIAAAGGEQLQALARALADARRRTGSSVQRLLALERLQREADSTAPFGKRGAGLVEKPGHTVDERKGSAAAIAVDARLGALERCIGATWACEQILERGIDGHPRTLRKSVRVDQPRGKRELETPRAANEARDMMM
jgi:hypothetical protein